MEARYKGVMYSAFGIIFEVVLCLLIIINVADREHLEEVIPKDTVTALVKIGNGATWVMGLIPEEWHFRIYLFLFMIGISMVLYSRFVWRIAKRLSSKERKDLLWTKQYLEEDVKRKKESLYKVVNYYFFFCLFNHFAFNVRNI